MLHSDAYMYDWGGDTCMLFNATFNMYEVSYIPNVTHFERKKILNPYTCNQVQYPCVGFGQTRDN